jgi:hypothetical protein
MNPLWEELEAGTREAQENIHRSRFLEGLVQCARGCGLYGYYFGCVQYVQLLRDWHHVYSALGDALDALPKHLGALNLKELHRTQVLERDLSFFAGEGWASHRAPSPCARMFSQRIYELTTEAPGLLAAHVYARCRTELREGPHWAQIIRDSFSLPFPQGTRFLSGAGAGSSFSAERHLRLALASTEPWLEREELVLEGRLALRLTRRVLDESTRFGRGPADEVRPVPQ